MFAILALLFASFFAVRAPDFTRPHIGLPRIPKRPRIPVVYDADDVDDVAVATVCAIIGAVCALTNTGLKVYDTVKGDDESEALAFAADDLVDRKLKFNPREIVKIAGQVAQIGHILGYDAEDIENGDVDAIIDVVCKIINTVCKVTDTGVKVHDTVKKSRGVDSLDLLSYDADDLDDVAVTTVCAIIGAVCALTNTGLSIYDHVKGDDETESLAFAADDLLDRKIRFNPRKITDIAGKINQIGQVLGYDADDLDDVAVATVCAIIGAICAVTGTGCNIYSHVKGEDAAESLEFDADDLRSGHITLNSEQVSQIVDKVQNVVRRLTKRY